jgi:tetratricopeptide (TPR) repeat protein
MNRTKMVVLSLGVGLLLTGAMYKLMNPVSKPAPSTPAAVGSGAAPATPAHEIAALEEELKKKPGHAPILQRLSELQSQSGAKDKAIELLREAVKSEPANLDSRIELGKALFEAGNILGAIEETKKILDTDPKHVDALYNLGAIHANVNQTAEARDYWKRAVAAAPDTESGKNAKAGLQKIENTSWVPTPKAQMPANHPAVPPE